jgi:circadian clock protein KaiC
VLVSGVAGTGKTSLAAHFVDAVCRSGGRCIYFAFEESPEQIVRNMRSIGIDLDQWTRKDKNLLHFHAARPTASGMEMHLVVMHKLIADFKPQAVVVDPITNFISVGNSLEVKSLLLRLIDFLKSMGITALFTSLTARGESIEQTQVGVSSLIDTWILLRDIESNGERNRGINVVKSRGMAHSNQIREFLLTDRGIQIADIYIGPGGILTGSAKAVQEANDRADRETRQQIAERRRLNSERKRQALEAQIAALRAEFDAEEAEVSATLLQQEQQESRNLNSRLASARIRKTGSSDEHVATEP